MGHDRGLRGPSIWQKTAQALPQPLTRFFQQWIRPYLPDVSFVSLHYLYFIATCMITSIILWGSSTPSRTVRFIDALFLCVSAMTEAGLNSVNLSQLNTWQQFILFVLIMMGSAIFVSSGVLHIRKRAFERKLEELAERKRRRSMRLARSLTFTFSRSKRRGSNASREEAVASGAVRGKPIKENQEKTEADLRPDQFDQEPAYANGAPRFRDVSTDRNEVLAPLRSGTHIRFEDSPRPQPTEGDLPRQLTRSATLSKLFPSGGVGARGMNNHPKNALPFHLHVGHTADTIETPLPKAFSKIDQWVEELGGFVGRNSQFHNLSEKDRRKLGGVEYDAICYLSWIVPIYFVLWQLIGAIGVGAYLQLNRSNETRTNGLNPFWTGAFFAVSAFNNSGMALLDANAVALQTSYYALLTLSLLILAGNTCFPPFLRLSIWIMRQCIPRQTSSVEWSKRRRILTFILDHPRRVYTNMFPGPQTWWLVFSLVLLNGVDWIAFEILNIGNPVTEAITPRFRALDGLFQAFAVRSGGFYVVSISALYPGLLVLYVLMMYVSALPVTMTIRNTNVYEERSLGIFSEDQTSNAQDGAASSTDQQPQSASTQPGVMTTLKRVMTSHHGITSQPQPITTSWTRQDFIRQQIRGQLGHDLWWLAIAILLIQIIETGQFLRDPTVFSTFNIIFEVVSAYGTVGISTGVPWNFYSFSGAWHTLSKLILCAVMLRGRHRGLPVAIDKAVLLPDETLAWAEEEDGRTRRQRGGGGGAAQRSADRTLRDIEEGRAGSPANYDRTDVDRDRKSGEVISGSNTGANAGGGDVRGRNSTFPKNEEYQYPNGENTSGS